MILLVIIESIVLFVFSYISVREILEKRKIIKAQKETSRNEKDEKTFLFVDPHPDEWYRKRSEEKRMAKKFVQPYDVYEQPCFLDTEDLGNETKNTRANLARLRAALGA